MTDKPAAAKVLAVSSQVVYGPVGNSAAVPAMQKLGLDVLALPTVLLSNHPGHAAPVRQVIAAQIMKAMLDRISDQGWLDGLAGVLTGYFVDATQVEVAAEAIARLKAADAKLLYVCDPIIGDDDGEGNPRLYVPEEVAQAIRSRLLPLADVITPNRCELSWLAGTEVTGPAAAVQPARRLAPLCLATSVPSRDDRIATMAIDSDSAWLVETRRRAHVPHGTGDLLSGLFLAHLLAGHGPCDALSVSLGAVEAVLDESREAGALQLGAGLARPGAHIPVQGLEVKA
jgi:pyridoxine kinase